MSLRDKANELAENARRYAVGHKTKIDDGIEKIETLVDKRGMVCGEWGRTSAPGSLRWHRSLSDCGPV